MGRLPPRTNEVSIGYDNDNRIHWTLRRRIKSVLRSEVSDGYKKNIVTVGYFATEKPEWEMAGRGSQLATSDPAPPRYVLQAKNFPI